MEAGRTLVRPGPHAEAPLDGPELTFYPGEEWVLRFADGVDGGPVVLYDGRSRGASRRSTTARSSRRRALSP